MEKRAYRSYDAIIIGAGVSGINAAYRIQTQMPGCRFVILEGRDSIGGTWDLFRYPGIRSDSDIYSFGFAWSPWYRRELLAQGGDIRQYMIDAAKQNGLDQHIKYHSKVLAANWVSKEKRWEISVQEGDSIKPAVYRGRFLFLGTGYYDYEQPRETTIPGLENFKGKVIHPQFWPKGYDYSGKEMVVIGSGATAVTIVPSVADKVKKVTMLQRSPTYMLPVNSRNWLRDLMFATLPAMVVHKANRVMWIILTYFVSILASYHPGIMKRLIRRENMRRLPDGYAWDPHFKPRYNPWEQRLCATPDGDIFAAIRAGKAAVATDTIERVTADAIELSSGERLPADVIVTATGIRLLFAGGVRFTIDDEAFDAPAKFVWRAAMIQDLPNVVFSMGYLKSGSWTLGADCAALLLVRLTKELEGRQATVVTPRTDGSTEMVAHSLFGGLNSNYLKGAEKQFPQTSTGIWCGRDNYIKDLYAAKWGDIEAGLSYE